MTKTPVFAVVHYDEIGLKGGNRPHFEKMLQRNIKIKLGKLSKECRRESGQMVVEIEGDAAKAREILSAIPGIAYFSFARKCDLDIEDMTDATLRELEGKEFETFRIDAQRHNKRFQLTSMKVNEIIGEAVVKKFKKKVKLKGPDISVRIDISNDSAYISTEKIEGIGGLPTNRKQKVISLLSGGFDSPVAAYMMMKRGCEVVFVHCRNETRDSAEAENKITDLCKALSRYQIKTKLYLIPFGKIQREIVMRVQPGLRMLVYRFFMIKIAEAIGEKEGSKFIIAGDSLSQVASQTFENLYATYKNAELHILSPLIGLNKSEIIRISKKIGTYEISARPYDDCCTLIASKHPELKATPEMIRKQAEQFDAEKLIEDAVSNARIEEY
ncbi:MAG: tRNA 4-thiouridine(8) synthase ThiI [Candidatus Micrarchaeota archaeon]|nr:tRNA 4-thiouridine(8) synthase ThiI [Candidatus Micrarchaeota archaeon]